jgi:uncharacterized small protein (DUF1192 family)
MSWDEDAVRPARAITLGEDLTRIALTELDERIVALEAEIERVKAVIVAKNAQLAEAEALFGE